MRCRYEDSDKFGDDKEEHEEQNAGDDEGLGVDIHHRADCRAGRAAHVLATNWDLQKRYGKHHFYLKKQTF